MKPSIYCSCMWTLALLYSIGRYEINAQGDKTAPNFSSLGMTRAPQASPPETLAKPDVAQRETTPVPTQNPTKIPTGKPTKKPTRNPTERPTGNPTAKPTRNPTAKPTRNPTETPTGNPTAKLTRNPTAKPTAQPTAKPTATQSAKPTTRLTANPTDKPSKQPTDILANKTDTESSTIAVSSEVPTSSPSKTPGAAPSKSPRTAAPAGKNDRVPVTGSPTDSPSTVLDTISPTGKPTESPTKNFPANDLGVRDETDYSAGTDAPTVPASESTTTATTIPTTITVTSVPSKSPNTDVPTRKPTVFPVTSRPSRRPTFNPRTLIPSTVPTTLDVVIVVEEEKEEDVSLLQQEQTEQNEKPKNPRVPSTTATPSQQTIPDVSKDYKATVVIKVSGISTLLTTASSLVVEHEVVNMLSEEIEEIEGVSVFFLRANLLHHSTFAVDDTERNDVTTLEMRIHALSVGKDTVQDVLFQKRIEKLLTNEKHQELQNRVLDALLIFAANQDDNQDPTSSNFDVSELENSSSDNTMNEVILMAILVFIFIALCGIAIGAVLFARRHRLNISTPFEKNSTNPSGQSHELQVKKSNSGFTGRSGVEAKAVLGSVIFAETRNVNGERLAPPSPSDIESCLSESVFSKTEFSESMLLTAYPSVMAAPSDEVEDDEGDFENIELVEGEENEKRQITTMLGSGDEFVQTAENLYQSERDSQIAGSIQNMMPWRRASQLETSFASTDSVMGNADGNVLNELALSDEEKKARRNSINSIWRKQSQNKPEELQRRQVTQTLNNERRSETSEDFTLRECTNIASGAGISVKSLGASGSGHGKESNKEVAPQCWYELQPKPDLNCDVEASRRGPSATRSRSRSLFMNGSKMYTTKNDVSSEECNAKCNQNNYSQLLKMKETLSTALSANQSELSSQESGEPHLQQLVLSESSGEEPPGQHLQELLAARKSPTSPRMAPFLGLRYEA